MLASLVKRVDLRKFTKRYYCPVMSAITKRWQPEMRRKYLQFFAHREEFSSHPDGVRCRGPTDNPISSSQTSSRWTAQGPSWNGKDEVFGSTDVVVAGFGWGYLHSSQELWGLSAQSPFLTKQLESISTKMLYVSTDTYVVHSRTDVRLWC